MTTNQTIKSQLHLITAWADGLANECRRTLKMLEPEDVSTSATPNMDPHVAQAVAKLKARIAKKTISKTKPNK